MDAPLIQDEDTNFIDVYIAEDAPATDSSLLKESLQREIEHALSTLSEKERDVLTLSFGIGSTPPLTLDEIAIRFNLTRERVRQIKDKAIRRLKSHNKQLKNFLGV